MASALLDIIDFNKNIDYGFIIPLMLIYLLLFWLLVSGWVGYDSAKRLKNKTKGILLGIANFIFGVPFLILYLLARPMEEEYGYSSSGEDMGGVNVPIVNFVGEEGVVMSLELRINSQKIVQDKPSEMKIDVSFNSLDENKKVIEAITDKTDSEAKPAINENSLKIFTKNIRNSVRKLQNKLAKSTTQNKQNISTSTSVQDAENSLNDTEQTAQSKQAGKHKKKSKKRH